MHPQPLVSVTMPAYNAEATILKAIKSLQMQTYSNWECIIVDDGSEDSTANIVNSIDDPRLKLIQLEKNMGRGYARQVALDNCKGDLIAMLDSDDWYYDNKLQSQVQAFIDNPELTVVSSGMAVTDNNGQLAGIRSSGDNIVKTFNKPTVVPLPHGACMYEASKAKKLKYDSRFKLAQDVDFMRRLLMNRKYMLLDQIGYVYEEQYSNTPKKTMRAYYYSALGYKKYLNTHPVYTTFRIGLEALKFTRVALYSAAGKYGAVISKRSQQPNDSQFQEFYEQKNKLDSTQLKFNN